MADEEKATRSSIPATGDRLGFIAMPTYVYQVITNDDTPGGEGEIFEVFQKMSDDPLTEHPESGAPVHRIPAPPLIAGKWSELGKDGGMMSNKNIDRLGFTKYEKAGDGHYEKKAGGGPDVISAD